MQVYTHSGRSQWRQKMGAHLPSLSMTTRFLASQDSWLTTQAVTQVRQPIQRLVNFDPIHDRPPLPSHHLFPAIFSCSFSNRRRLVGRLPWNRGPPKGRRRLLHSRNGWAYSSCSRTRTDTLRPLIHCILSVNGIHAPNHFPDAVRPAVRGS